MRWGMAFVLCIAIAGCGIAEQPESARTVAAFEIPLPTEADRTAFLSLLGEIAEAEGLHVDATSPEELERSAQVSPHFRHTLRAGVWRGADDNEPVASMMDLPDNLGQIWITFTRGEDPVLARQFRERAMQAIRRRWPGTLVLPIMPTGAIPLPSDLIRTPDGYVVDPAKASLYGFAPGNPAP